jgi:hypothetical protein
MKLKVKHSVQPLLGNGTIKLMEGQIHRIDIALRQVRSGRTKTKLAHMKGNFDEPDHIFVN